MDKHLFSLPMDNDGLCGRCGKSCIDEIHISHDEYVLILRKMDEERKRSHDIHGGSK